MCACVCVLACPLLALGCVYVRVCVVTQQLQTPSRPLTPPSVGDVNPCLK